MVGLGLMEYYGTHSSPARGQQVYREYIKKAACFAAWLIAQKHSVRLVIGDLAYDQRAIGDVLRILEQDGPILDAGQIVAEPVASVEQLDAQLAQSDIVVATRFHNVVFALMLDKPVLAISYHVKVRALMAEMGLADCCTEMELLDLQRINEQLVKLERTAGSLKSVIKQRTEEYQTALDAQYRHIFNDL